MNFLSLVFLWACSEEPHSKEIPPVQIPLNGPPPASGYQKKYHFTQDMFFGRSHLFMLSLEKYKDKPDVHYLEIGVHEGRSFFWVLDNIMTHPSSSVTGIDLFDVGEGNFKPSEQYGNTEDYKQRYFKNVSLSGQKQRIHTHVGYSQDVLKTLKKNSYDVIYIDGCHTLECAREDSKLSWLLLKKGGRILFDDYDKKDFSGVYTAVNELYQRNRKEIRVVHNGWVMIFEKK